MGGGTGLANLLKGLKKYVRNPNPGISALEPRITELSAVVTVTDDGGSSGRLRKEFNMIPPGDIRNCIAALSEDEALLSRLFRRLDRNERPVQQQVVHDLDATSQEERQAHQRRTADEHDCQ